MSFMRQVNGRNDAHLATPPSDPQISSSTPLLTQQPHSISPAILKVHYKSHLPKKPDPTQLAHPDLPSFHIYDRLSVSCIFSILPGVILKILSNFELCYTS